MRTFRYIYVNCFNRFTSTFTEVSTKLHSTFLDNLQTIILERNMEAGQMTPICSSTFSALFITFIFYLKIAKIHFDAVPPLVHSGLQNIHHTFQESRHLRLLKIHIIFCSPSGAKKRYQLMDYNASSKFFL